MYANKVNFNVEKAFLFATLMFVQCSVTEHKIYIITNSQPKPINKNFPHDTYIDTRAVTYLLLDIHTNIHTDILYILYRFDIDYISLLNLMKLSYCYVKQKNIFLA